MAKRIIECTVSDEYVVGGGVPIGAAGSHDDVALRLAFGEMWAGLNIYATFTDALGENPTVVMLLASMLVDGKSMTYDVPIPAAAKKFEGQASLSLTGYVVTSGTEGVATNTATTYFRVLPSKVALADDGTVDATLAQQLQSEMNFVEERVGEAEVVASNVMASVAEFLDVANGAKEIAEEVKAMADRGEFDGDPYVLTEADKAAIVAATIEALPKYTGEVIDV